MKPLSEFGHIYLYPGPVDFRKSIDGLSYLVEQSMKLDPFEPALFLFCNRAKDGSVANKVGWVNLMRLSSHGYPS